MLLYEMPRAVLRGACLQYIAYFRLHCGFAWFNAALESASAHEERLYAVEVIIPWRRCGPRQTDTGGRRSQVHARKRISARRAPRGGGRLLYHGAAKPDKTAFTAVLHGSMFSSPGGAEETGRAVSGLEAIIHGREADKPQMRFAWFNVSRKRISARRAPDFARQTQYHIGLADDRKQQPYGFAGCGGGGENDDGAAKPWPRSGRAQGAQK